LQARNFAFRNGNKKGRYLKRVSDTGLAIQTFKPPEVVKYHY